MGLLMVVPSELYNSLSFLREMGLRTFAFLDQRGFSLKKMLVQTSLSSETPTSPGSWGHRQAILSTVFKQLFRVNRTTRRQAGKGKGGRERGIHRQTDGQTSLTETSESTRHKTHESPQPDALPCKCPFLQAVQDRMAVENRHPDRADRGPMKIPRTRAASKNRDRKPTPSMWQMLSATLLQVSPRVGTPKSLSKAPASLSVPLSTSERVCPRPRLAETKILILRVGP